MMYINNFVCPYELKKGENKCGRIFRPWDSENASNDSSQDCTVSTTTQEDEEVVFLPEDGNQATIKINCYKSNESEPNELKDFLPSFSEILDSKNCPNNSMNISSKLYSPLKTSSLPSKVLKSEANKLPESIPLQLTPHFEEAILFQQHNQTSLASPADTLLKASTLSADFIRDPYNPLYPEIMQTNLAQHLGLPPNDPLLLESIAQGYAIEEYARVLNQEQQAKLLAAKKQRPKKYKCPHCDVGFSNNGQLKGHIRIHTGERPFKCDDKDCGKTFTRNEELTRHKRIHSGLRPFPCTHCGKRFGRKDHLKKHSRTHFQPRGLYAVPVVLPFEAWASGQTNGYPFLPLMY